MSDQRKRLIGWGLALLWGVFALGGSIAMYQHAYSGDHPEYAGQQWPSLSKLTRGSERATLIVFAHPKCPCTRATIDSLSQVVRDTKCDATIVFWQPASSSKSDTSGWTTTPVIEKAKGIESLQIVMDPDGVESSLFGANTSGHCIAFSASGELLYSGGITSSRGHTGNNIGLESLIQAIQTGHAQKSLPVFGCRFHP